MRLLFVTCFSLLAGCAVLKPSAAPEASLTTNSFAYRQDEKVTLGLNNGTAGVIGYNLCTAQLEREVGNGWRPVAGQEPCPAMMRMLEPGKADWYEQSLKGRVEEGQYRFKLRIYHQESGRQEDLVTRPFAVSQ